MKRLLNTVSMLLASAVAMATINAGGSFAEAFTLTVLTATTLITMTEVTL